MLVDDSVLGRLLADRKVAPVIVQVAVPDPKLDEGGPITHTVRERMTAAVVRALDPGAVAGPMTRGYYGEWIMDDKSIARECHSRFLFAGTVQSVAQARFLMTSVGELREPLGEEALFCSIELGALVSRMAPSAPSYDQLLRICRAGGAVGGYAYEVDIMGRWRGGGIPFPPLALRVRADDLPELERVIAAYRCWDERRLTNDVLTIRLVEKNDADTAWQGCL